ncbi:MAG: transcription antitermination factor NusB [Bryobacteraceae bacterium]
MAARHRSRKRALQVLFEWDMRGDPVDQAISNYYNTLYSEENENQLKPDRFMEELVRGTVEKAPQIDQQIQAKAEHWRLERMAVVDRNILRLAIYELMQNAVPAPIIIDEALELARQFSGDESMSFINGVLDAIRRQVLAANT